MLKIDSITLFAKWLPFEKQFFIYGTNHWKDVAFTWHEESYYGSFLTDATYEGIDGVFLSPWEALRYFANPGVNSLANIKFAKEAMSFLEIAPTLLNIIIEEDFEPDFEKWKNGEIGWKTTQQLDEFAHVWLSLALNDLFTNDEEMKHAWQDVVDAFPLLTNTSGQAFVLDEEDFFKKIGWIEDDAPFTMALELVEPNETSNMWTLKTILRSKKKKAEIYEYIPGKLPAKWQNEEERIKKELTRWANFIPIKEEYTEEEAWTFLTDTSETLMNAGVEILLPSWWKALKDAKIAMKARVKSTSSSRKSFVGLNALMDFDWRFSTNGVELSEAEFLALVSEKRKLVQIRGKWIKLDPAFIQQMKQLLDKANKEGLKFRDILEQQLLSDKTSTDTDYNERIFKHIQIELNKQTKEMIHHLTEIKSIPSVMLPTSFQGTLRPYQKQGVDWLLFMRKFGFGACLADDMGLGKTVQMIAYFLYVKQHEKMASPHLIICPTSVIGNWQKELERFAPDLQVQLYYGTNRELRRDADVVITSYGLAQADEEILSEIEWETICLDEAQNIKNAHTKQSRAIRHLKGVHKIALTGTPMENRLTELWAIFDFINHGYLGSLSSFQRNFVTPIEKEHDADKISTLQKFIRPFLLRRTKTDEEVALNLPEKLEQKEYCALTVEQASLYEQLVTDTFKEIEQLDGIKRRGLILKLLGQLKQICDHPALYLKEELEDLSFIERSNKLETLVELVGNILSQQESCLIFTQYISMGNMIKTILETKFGESVLFLNGSIPKSQRDEMITSFQERKQRIFILSLKAGGTGLNLTAANHVIHYDRWWNPAVENQATDRAYRIGQKRFVHVHKLITTGTLEEKIDKMLEEKQALNNEIITSENWITELSNDELKTLLGA